MGSGHTQSDAFGPRFRASPRAMLRCLGLSASIAIAGCSSNCLDPDEVGIVTSVTPNKGLMVDAVSFRLQDGTARTCTVANLVAMTVKPGDKFKGKLGGEPGSDTGWKGQR